MPSIYIQPTDYAQYGLAANTSTQQVQQASAMVDSYLKRPEGMLYGVDGNGYPAYMLNKVPSAQLTCAAGIQPGKSVTFTVNGPCGMLQVGDVLLIDIANQTVTEAVQVLQVLGQQITVTSVQFTHAANCQLTAGVVITETKKPPNKIPLTRVSRTPIAYPLSGAGRYAYGRRSDDFSDTMQEFNMLAVFTNFGGPPQWEAFEISPNSMNSENGELWIPPGILLAYYTDVRWHYVAGFSYATLPDAIKQAVALTVYAMQQNTPMGSVKGQNAGDSALQFFAASALSDDVKDLLKPWVARGYV